MSLTEKIKTNWKSGLTVSLVSMPLSISLAVASGSTPAIGILTAIWAGLVASLFGGSNFNIIGPTGALSGLIATYVIIHGSNSLAILTVIAGTFILVAYALRLERYLIFIPSSVIHGFTLGVALIIGFTQFNSALGLYGLPKHESFFQNLIESFKHINNISWTTFIIFTIFLALLFILRKITIKIPAPIVVAVVGIGLGYLQIRGIFNLQFATLGSVFRDVHFTFLAPVHFSFSYSIFASAAAIALIAILETMLSAKIADGMTRTKHNERREMLGLGLANIASGLAGGIPATAALARTSLNVKTGANNKISATFNVIFLFVISFLFLTYFSYIPMAVIAAILVYVAINMVEAEHFIKFYRYQKSGFILSLAVAAVTFYKDPITGILVGTVIALLLFVDKISRGHFNIKLNTFEDGLVKTISGDKITELGEHADILLYSVEGRLAYINSQAHIKRFEENLIKYKTIILRLKVYFIDIDGAEAIEEIISIIENRGQTVCLSSLSDRVSDILEQISPRFKRLREQGLVFPKSEDALRHFGVNIKNSGPSNN